MSETVTLSQLNDTLESCEIRKNDSKYLSTYEVWQTASIGGKSTWLRIGLTGSDLIKAFKCAVIAFKTRRTSMHRRR
jgi:hypothetical protein